ncbi:MAG TPA: helix-turn-helix domain-containing protein [Actinomycetota bacterium]|nr:helix-turn-helix domain-containing protein [Actinomycetota bacterium]
MAGSVTDPRPGVGSALQRAREVRGLSLDEAARDTRLRVDQLDALEREDFDVLPGEVYVRASLRTYANYLGLDADKVSDAYARTAVEAEPAPPPGKLGTVERMIAASRIRDNQRFLLVAAITILLILLALGVLSRGEAAPPAGTIPAGTASPVPTDPTIRVVVVARSDVTVGSEADGKRDSQVLRPGETITLVALERLDVSVTDAGLVEVSLNGKAVTEGVAGLPHTYRFEAGGDGGNPSSSG